MTKLGSPLDWPFGKYRLLDIKYPILTELACQEFVMLHFYKHVYKYYLTEHFTISEPQNPPINNNYFVQKVSHIFKGFSIM